MGMRFFFCLCKGRKIFTWVWTGYKNVLLIVLPYPYGHCTLFYKILKLKAPCTTTQSFEPRLSTHFLCRDLAQMEQTRHNQTFSYGLFLLRHLNPYTVKRAMLPHLRAWGRYYAWMKPHHVRSNSMWRSLSCKRILLSCATRGMF